MEQAIMEIIQHVIQWGTHIDWLDMASKGFRLFSFGQAFATKLREVKSNPKKQPNSSKEFTSNRRRNMLRAPSKYRRRNQQPPGNTPIH